MQAKVKVTINHFTPNRKSYMHFRLALKAITLNDIKHQNNGLIKSFRDFSLWHIFQKRMAPKSLNTDQDNLRMTFSASNVDFNKASLDPLG